MRPVWVGSSAPAIGLLDEGAVTAVGTAGRPAFLAEHPRLPRLYAVDETDPGSVATFAVGPDRALTPTGEIGSGGSSPCHLLVHPDGSWLYTTNYGDGVVTALALDAHGDPTGDRVELPHEGSGPRADRQERSHAHSTVVSPGGGWLIAADLGTDHLRSHRLRDGRPDLDAVLTALPPGTGPRHMALHGDLVHVAGELSTQVLTVRWDEASGRGEVVGAVDAVTLPPRSGSEHSLSHLELVDGVLVVGVRGADSLSVVGLVDGVVSRVLAEVRTVAWPRHLTVVDRTVLVAGERADMIGSHPIELDPHGVPCVGELAGTVPTNTPMCLLPVLDRSR